MYQRWWKGWGRGEWALALARAASVSQESGLHTNPGRSVSRCSRRPWRLYHQTNVIDWKLQSDMIRQITAVNDPPSFFPPCFAPNALSLHHERFIYLFIFWGIQIDRERIIAEQRGHGTHASVVLSHWLTLALTGGYVHCINQCGLKRCKEKQKQKTLSISLPHMQTYAAWQAKTFQIII